MKKSVDPIALFWEKVNKRGPRSPYVTTRCWLWTGATAKKGYGNVNYNGKYKGAHVVSFELAFQPVPTGRQVNHLCHVRLCVNPKHLYKRGERQPMASSEGYTVGRVFCSHETLDSIKCVALEDMEPCKKGEEFWVPQSQVHDDSEVYKKGQQGKLVVKSWLARQRGWEDV